MEELMKLLYVLPLLLVMVVHFAYADVTIEPAQGSGVAGCEDTADGCYIPSIVSMDLGESAIFLNMDNAAHTFTSGTPADGPDGIFDTSLLMIDTSYEWSPDTVGEYPYFCMVHPWMVGVIVVDGDVPIPAPIPDPSPIPGELDELKRENERLRGEVLDLKLENRDLKITITDLETEIDSLKNQILVIVAEFAESLTKANEWYREN